MRYVSLIFFLATYMLSAQGFKRYHYLPGSITHLTKGIYELPTAGYISAGLIVEPYNNQTSNRLAIMGLDQAGQLLWTKKYGSYKFEYLENSLQNSWFFKLAGSFYFISSVRDSTNSYYGALIKFNVMGDTVWQKTFRDNSLILRPQSITLSVDGGFLISGDAPSTSSSAIPCFVIKTDVNGNELWRKYINKTTPNEHDAKAIIQDSASKKIILVGYQTINSNGPNDNIIILDSLGNKLQQNSLAGVYGGGLRNIIQTKDKNFVVIGSKRDSKVVGSFNMETSFAMKFNLSNPTVSMWKIDGFDKPGLYNGFTHLEELENGELIFIGLIDTCYESNQPVNINIRLTKVASTGQILFNRFYNYKYNPTTANNNIQPKSFSRTSDGGYIASIEVLNNTNPNPMFFVKFDGSGCDSSSAHCATLNLVGLEPNTVGQQLTIWPNPASDQLFIDVGQLPPTNTIVQLFNTLGELILVRTIDGEITKIAIPDLPKGIYFLKIFSGSTLTRTTKLIKE